ncbi:hypothetical protein HOP52_08675 [Halomonas campisalis]|uniref:Uncharacterized protein n=1 Tax=Billgrantia campisalis TaxID=74661 RepID=A0ABS9P7R2_9GAMM|nr:hypothetical protein [Halomonas campisalis]MCG6657827.1 hypothetical protein [Halomonas campisalis]MDR5864701.1 hypothetical protein [Halomonas campisalis]
MFRTLAMLRSLQSAHDSLQDTRETIQRACDYRWLRRAFPGGVLTARSRRLHDGTPAVTITLPFVATAERMRGGNWPSAAAEREGCRVDGAHACRAAGAPTYRTLESLSQGLAHGAVGVLPDAARFDYLLRQRALTLTWRRVASLSIEQARALLETLGDDAEAAKRDGLLLLEVSVPCADDGVQASGEWLDGRLDQYRRLLPSAKRS